MALDLQSSRDLLIALGLVTGAGILGWLFKRYVHKRLKKIAAKTNWRGDDVVLEAVESSSLFWFILGGVYLALGRLTLSESLMETVQTVVVVLLILSVTVSLAKIAVGLLEMFAESNDAFPSTTMISNLVRIVIITVGALVVFQTLGISITPVLTALGVGGLAISLALKDTLSDLFAGLHILLSRKVVPGDLVELDTLHKGTVRNISWRNTIIQDRRNNTVVIPNSRLSTAIMRNFDMPVKQLIARVACGVSYDSDLEQVEQVVLEVANNVQSTVEGAISDYEPSMVFISFGESSIDFRVSMGAEHYSGQWAVTHEFIKQISKRFGEEGIEIPFPIRTVYQKNNV
ncbi:MAG: mechanosensitive ion channel protein MscS [Candidatus Marinimicrobia bacterium]|nr:mechanosensitive ion channel protein MscS [Candidatus Neomarinimicrobiota bacterium]|tara:strand:+ start:2992 stop:4026 length:1035 start_codon:yes stop_codon:yes gene_type:complete